MTASASASSPIASGPSRGQPKSQWASSDVRSGCPEDRKASAKTRTLSSVCCARTRRPGAKALCADNCQMGAQQKGSGLCGQIDALLPDAAQLGPPGRLFFRDIFQFHAVLCGSGQSRPWAPGAMLPPCRPGSRIWQNGPIRNRTGRFHVKRKKHALSGGRPP